MDWAGQLTRSLSAYLADIARLLNGAVQTDGTTPMEGNLDMGGFDIINADDITGDLLTANQIKFPATPVPSADPNTIDDFEENTWTPTLTFTTPGNLNVVYATRVGTYQKIGSYVTLLFDIQTSTFTHTTASGTFQMTGLPFPAAASPSQGAGSLSFQGITVGTYIQFGPRVVGGSSTIDFIISASGAARALLDASHLPTGTVKLLSGQVTYKAA